MDLAGTPRLGGKKKMAKPWLDGKRRKIFVGDLSDVFSPGFPYDYLKQEIIDVANSPEGRRHDLLCLTKQIGEALDFAYWITHECEEPWPDNVWLGVSVIRNANRSRAEQLRKHPAKYKFISLEPQLEDVDLDGYLDSISWVISGGESDQAPFKARPFHLEWARKTLEQCHKHGTKFFLKQYGSNPYDGGKPIVLKDGHGGDWDEWEYGLKVREAP